MAAQENRVCARLFFCLLSFLQNVYIYTFILGSKIIVRTNSIYIFIYTFSDNFSYIYIFVTFSANNLIYIVIFIFISRCIYAIRII